MASFVRNFDKAVGSPDDGNIPANAIDVYDSSRFSSNDPNAFWEGQFNQEVKDIVAIDLGFYKGKERRTLFTLSYIDEQGRLKPESVAPSGNPKIPQGYKALGGYETSGTTTGFQRFVFKAPINAVAIRVAFDSNTSGELWLSITSSRVILGHAIDDVPVGPDNGSGNTGSDGATETQTEPQTPNVDNSGSSGSGQSIELVYADKVGGQVVKDFEGPKRSSHNTGARDSFYSKPKSFFSAVNAQVAGYFRTKLSTSDQGVIKILSGGHGNDNPKQGRCVAIGPQINIGKASTAHLAKEWPQHPTTPKFPNKINLILKTPLPDLNDKWFGLRINYWVTAAKSLKGKVDIDLSQVNNKADKLTECPNKWQDWFTFEDKGDWTGEPIIENSGAKFNGTKLGFYVRIDKVTYPTKFGYLQAVEIVPPTT